MSAHNNLGPRHLPTWLGVTLISGLWFTAFSIQEHFQPAAGWFGVAEYIVLLFATAIFSLRPAWGRRTFWLSVGILFGLHAVAGLLLVLLFPTWLPPLHSFLTVIVVSDGLLTMSVLWRVTVAHDKKSL
jgi:hypothetical protein